MSDAPAPRPALDPHRLAALPAPLRVEINEATPSTNALVAARAKAGEPAGLVVVTEHQTAGRGRLNRVWETPPRVALTFSVLVRPDVPLVDWTWLPLLTGYAVQAAVADRVPEVTLKWPNDLLVGDLKLAGILLERVESPVGPAAVLGIGLNVNQTEAELPVPTATSLRRELGFDVDRTDLLVQVLGSLHALQPLLHRTGELRAAYSAVCSTLGRTVEVHLPDGQVTVAEAIDIDAHGSLVLAGDEGTTVLSAGDVVHVRPLE